MSALPDTLVLGGGGSQGDAWMTGVLAGLEAAHGYDLRACEYFVGTSAGSVVAARLAGGESPRRIDAADISSEVSTGSRRLPAWITAPAAVVAAPLAYVGLSATSTVGAWARAAALRALPEGAGHALDFHGDGSDSGARFDGRLRIVAVDRMSGRRVVFGAPGAPAANIPQALAASCAIPLMFSPAVIAGREYVDGAVWSPTNADVAPAARESQVLVLAPMASLHGPFNPTVRAAARASMLLEAASLRARGARVRMLAPDRRAAASIGPKLMSRDRVDQTHAAGYAQGAAL